MPKPVKPSELSEEAIAMIAERFKLLSEPTRLKILIALEQGEKNVTELAEATRATQPNVSRQLAILNSAGLLARRKAGAAVYYSLADAAIFSLCQHVCGSLQERLLEQGKAAKWFGG